MLIKYLILSIICSITNSLSIGTTIHILLLNNIFNTNIFTYINQVNFFYLSIPLSTIYLLIKRISKKNLVHIIKLLSLVTITTPLNLLFIRNYSFKYLPLLFILSSLYILVSTNKNGHKELSSISIKEYLIIIVSQILNLIIPSPIITNLIISKIIKLNKDSSIILALVISSPTYLIVSLTNLPQSYIRESILSLLLCTILSINILNKYINIYKNNKQYKLSIYLIILSIFTLFYFR